ncbi:MAG: ATP-dependent DNA helicase RecG [Chitinispirillales bacterium]|jgi:ATP-dependent DNA helicase RecG|nr:ATP-dependent DNA helicase RecG [Chitinispirillales bacterium]
MSQTDFLTPLRRIPGLGPKRLSALEAAGITTVGCLLYYFPAKYIDRSNRVSISDAGNFGDAAVTVLGTVERARTEYAGRARFRATVRDDSGGTIDVIWYVRSMTIAPGETLLLTGKVLNSNEKLLMYHPVLEKIPKDSDGGGVKPILAFYSIKEPMREAGINQNLIRKSVEWAFENIEPDSYPRTLPAAIEKNHDFPPLEKCLRNIHQPEDLSTLDAYKKRLKYEELYKLALNLRWNRKKFALPGYAMVPGELDAKLRALLPFTLTESQERAVEILYGDAAKPERMHRLLQGDVGSGKTVTALFAALPALNRGRQVAWMAPTEVLAKQTMAVIEKYMAELGFKAGYIGAGDSAEKREAVRGLVTGELRFVVGTHALFMPSVKFGNLGMVIIDEQHKFGAAQRLTLQEKGPASDFLLMSATPIPQTLAKTLYGDLGIVEITSRSGRAPVSTHVVPDAKRAGMENFILEQITAGNRAFYIAPRIEQEESVSIKTVDSVVEKLQQGPLAAAPVHKLHGQMSHSEREAAIDAFRNGPPGVLAATTIIEVGIDIPNATVMVIENPELFGLAQLHQIRGRVGRGDAASYCFLLPGTDASGASALQNEDTLERLKYFCSTMDGFKIAEWDLRNRGPGDTDGVRQSGRDDLRVADILEDAEMFRGILAETERLFTP